MLKTIIAALGLAFAVSAAAPTAIPTLSDKGIACCSMPCCKDCGGAKTCCCGGACCG